MLFPSELDEITITVTCFSTAEWLNTVRIGIGRQWLDTEPIGTVASARRHEESTKIGVAT